MLDCGILGLKHYLDSVLSALFLLTGQDLLILKIKGIPLNALYAVIRYAYQMHYSTNKISISISPFMNSLMLRMKEIMKAIFGRWADCIVIMILETAEYGKALVL